MALSFRFVANTLGLFRSEAKNHDTPFDFDELKVGRGRGRLEVVGEGEGRCAMDGHWCAVGCVATRVRYMTLHAVT